MVILRISYHVLGVAVFIFGLLLVIKLPNSTTLVGDYFFNLPEKKISIHILGALIQIIGILLFLKWFGENGNQQHIKFYKRFEPILLFILVLLPPVFLNAFVDSTAKAFAYAGKDHSNAVEYVKNQSSCTLDTKKFIAKCEITLKNYNHYSQRVTLLLNWQGQNTKTPVYLLRRQEKKVYIQIPLTKIYNPNVKPNIEIY